MASEKQELDLIDIVKDFFVWIKNLTNKIWNGLLSFIRFSFQQIKILIIFFILGIGAGTIASLSYFRVYKSDLILRMNVSDAYTFYGYTKSLDAQVVSDEPLAIKLSIPDSIANSIVSIKPHYVIDNLCNGTPDWIDYDDKYVETDTLSIKMFNMLAVTVKSKNLYIFSEIQNGLMHFYTNNPTLKREKDVLIAQQTQSMEFIQKEIERLDSLSNYDYFKEPKRRSLTVDSQAVLLGERPKQLYYSDMAKLNHQKDSLQKMIEVYGNVASVVQPFSVSKVPVNSLPKMIVIFCGIFIVLGYIVAACIKYRTRIRQFLNERD